jgi:uncharacterized protein
MQNVQKNQQIITSCCPSHLEANPFKSRLLVLTTLILTISYVTHLVTTNFSSHSAKKQSLIQLFNQSIYTFSNQIFIGVVLGIVAVGLLNQVPRDFIMRFLGRERGFKGLIKATLAGLMLDLCSHGILLVGLKLYERGASLGQTVAFLVASPWNSLSLTIILYNLVGAFWTSAFILFSLAIALTSGSIFDLLVNKKLLPKNPNRRFNILEEDNQKFSFKELFRSFKSRNIFEIFKSGALDSIMIIKWLFLGVILASLLRTFLDPAQYQSYFGSHIGGVFNTLVFATVFETCSEGSTPVAADILNYALAPGNSFLFLMAGAATDYSEIMGLKERTKSWRIALALPFIVLPQSLLIALLLNWL